MSEKVKISREQENLLNERISYYKKQGLNQNQIVSCIFDDKKSKGFFEGTSFHSMGTFDFMKILIGNYEVEQTPEEILLHFYNVTSGYDKDLIRTVLRILEIEIEGVNA